MFDLTRITEFVSDFIAKDGAGAGLQEILQNLGENGIEISQLEGLDSEQFISLLGDNGIELSQLDPAQLSQLADQLGIALPVGDAIEPFAGRTIER